jgi:hypothetical protein
MALFKEGGRIWTLPEAWEDWVDGLSRETFRKELGDGRWEGVVAEPGGAGWGKTLGVWENHYLFRFVGWENTFYMGEANMVRLWLADHVEGERGREKKWPRG